MKRLKHNQPNNKHFFQSPQSLTTHLPFFAKKNLVLWKTPHSLCHSLSESERFHQNTARTVAVVLSRKCTGDHRYLCCEKNIEHLLLAMNILQLLSPLLTRTLFSHCWKLFTSGHAVWFSGSVSFRFNFRIGSKCRFLFVCLFSFFFYSNQSIHFQMPLWLQLRVARRQNDADLFWFL